MINAIDACVHPFFPQFAAKYSQFGYWEFLGPEWQAKARKGWEVQHLIGTMDNAGVAITGLLAFWSVADSKDCFITPEELNPILQEHRDRLFGLVGLNPLLPISDRHFAPRYLEHAVKEFGFKAAHIGLHWFGMSPSDKRLYPIYEKCLELDIPIVLPLGAAPPRSGARSIAEPFLLDPVIGDYHELKIVGQSVGYPWERESVYLARNNANFSILADSPAPQHWIPDFVGFIKQGRFPKYDAGSDQVMWGSNFPLHELQESRRQFDGIGFSEPVAQQLLRDNAVRIFKLDVKN